MRTVVTGIPRSGKSTFAGRLAEEHDVAVWHCDDVVHLGWSESSALVATWLSRPGPWVIDGCAAARALRKWMRAHPGDAPPVDRVIVMTEPMIELSDAQARMGKGVLTVLNELSGWLKHRIQVCESVGSDAGTPTRPAAEVTRASTLSPTESHPS